jgi:hypothetical protein
MKEGDDADARKWRRRIDPSRPTIDVKITLIHKAWRGAQPIDHAETFACICAIAFLHLR